MQGIVVEQKKILVSIQYTLKLLIRLFLVIGIILFRISSIANYHKLRGTKTTHILFYFTFL